MTTELICIATFTAKTGKANALRNALSDLLEPTRQEEGCLSYILHENLNNPNVFTMIERFKNRTAFELHSKAPYIVNFRENLFSDLVVKGSRSVELYKEIG